MTNDNQKSNIGFTLFKPTGVKHEYSVVDVHNKQVTGTISYNGKVYMTVHVDLKTNTVDIDGSIKELEDIAMDKASYIDLFKSQAEFFVENNIRDPKKYYKQFE
ncbi:hypothetical protein [Gracilibacillus salinarum]|uniref:Uncharacterized protein n=1 Tax=Gracilibacillus salinarum TaxID=2932255 RepID=A0ABY4GKI2_9BACI|nr:hypothetical protein [Gracilibacillus salinarum]UOQ84719.1 hypothetical protein MUN87_18985 [Gracilibacillus salinarum]